MKYKLNKPNVRKRSGNIAMYYSLSNRFICTWVWSSDTEDPVTSLSKYNKQSNVMVLINFKEKS